MAVKSLGEHQKADRQTVLAPLEGVRVLNLGGIWAGRVTSMLLADQGADVIDINKPAGADVPARALLSRGKRELELDLASESGRGHALRLAETADIVIDNLGAGRSARFGLEYETLKRANNQLVYISMPAIASGAPSAEHGQWEAAIAASVGVFTDIHALGPVLGGRPNFTALPMASAYGGVHGAIAASAAYLHRLNTGRGAHVEVPLQDALLSAMALLIMRIENQPQYFDLPPIDKSMSEVALPILRDLEAHLAPEHRAAVRSHLAEGGPPFFANHRCKDDRFIFINAIGHVHQPRACLEALGLLNDLIAEGITVASPYDVATAGSNISDSGGLSVAWRKRIFALMSARLLSRTAAEWEAALQAAGVPVTVVRSTEEWLNLTAALEAGCVSTLYDPRFGTTRQAGRFVTIAGEGLHSPRLRARSEGHGEWLRSQLAPAGAVKAAGANILEGLRVIDLSNVIAGPVSARTLAELGADVIRIDPVHPQAGPRMTMWFGIDVNQGKRAIILDLKSARGQRAFHRLVRDCDVLVHNFLDRSLEGIGVCEQQLRQINPELTICQISAWGGPDGGPFKDFPAYDPVLQAATGITTRFGSPGAPVMHGLASCVDYITGFSATLGMLHALIARKLGRGASHVRTSLAMGAQLVQFPFMVQAHGVEQQVPSGQETHGYGAHYRLYRASDGWIVLCSRPSELDRIAGLLESSDSSEAAVSAAIAKLSTLEISRRISPITSASATAVTRLDKLREAILIPEASQADRQLDGRALLMIEREHPSGHRVALPVPSWYRSAIVPPALLAPAPKPGRDTEEVLAELGYSQPEIHELIAARTAATAWPISPDYFPKARRGA
ncbi:crotonobetainyl-CoA:carnitine CoA-transferase CaiB-like acyl-CoA transferase [Bradyrhizobium sp. USDA 4011]